MARRNIPHDIRIPLWMRYLPSSLHPYIHLGRHDRLAALWMLFFPCLWSFVLSGIETVPVKTLILFFFGALLMRGAGCTINDMTDQKIDSGVRRTRERPLAKGVLNNKQALLFLGAQLLLGLLILLQFNLFTILIGIAFIPLVILYPFMKRWTHWAQLFLGFTFNGGVLMAWTACHDYMPTSVLVLYGAAILWTLGYDTIYGCQDREDDITLGLKSTAILFCPRLKLFLSLCFSGMVFLLVLVGIMESLRGVYYGLLSLVLLVFLYQLIALEVDRPQSCLNVFRQQKVIGLLVFLAFLMGKF
jgi:4-hydroxybenzoate polyprenyltransferase